VQQAKQNVGARLLAEATLHSQLQVARLEVVRDRIARPAVTRSSPPRGRRGPPPPSAPFPSDRRFDRKPATKATPVLIELRRSSGARGWNIQAHPRSVNKLTIAALISASLLPISASMTA
jgi:hypothetical protein